MKFGHFVQLYLKPGPGDGLDLYGLLEPSLEVFVRLDEVCVQGLTLGHLWLLGREGRCSDEHYSKQSYEHQS